MFYILYRVFQTLALYQFESIMMNVMLDKRIVSAAVIICAISGILYISWFIKDPMQVPPPESAPGLEPIVYRDGDVELWAEAEFSQDFMPAIPPEGPPFYAFIKINITNTGNSTISNLGASRATVYYNDTLDPLVTLNLTSAIQYFKEVEIRPGESIVMEFINDRSEIFSPTIEEGTVLFARVVFTWGEGNEQILTTPPKALMFTH
jgi:hypothetical protein